MKAGVFSPSASRAIASTGRGSKSAIPSKETARSDEVGAPTAGRTVAARAAERRVRRVLSMVRRAFRGVGMPTGPSVHPAPAGARSASRARPVPAGPRRAESRVRRRPPPARCPRRGWAGSRGPGLPGCGRRPRCRSTRGGPRLRGAGTIRIPRDTRGTTGTSRRTGRRRSRSLAEAPWRIEPVLAGPIQADGVAVRVAQPRLAPQPRLVGGPRLERDAVAGEALADRVEGLAFQVDHREFRPGNRAGGEVQRQRRPPAGALEARIAGQAVDDLRKAEALVEDTCLPQVAGRQGHLIEVHGAWTRAGPGSLPVRFRPPPRSLLSQPPNNHWRYHMNRRQLGLAAATTAFALLAAGVPMLAAAGSDGGVKCAGLNECKGQSECKTATSECKGLNGCKGEGFVTKKSAQECVAAGGKVIS